MDNHLPYARPVESFRLSPFTEIDFEPLYHATQSARFKLVNTDEIMQEAEGKAMIPGKKTTKVIVTMPAYNAAKTLLKTFEDIPKGTVSEVILVDDCSSDDTVAVGSTLDIKIIRHPHNVGYGGNQKTCYLEALRDGADIVIMLHPDYQYDPEKYRKSLPRLSKEKLISSWVHAFWAAAP